jgi:transposase, IS6 family
VFSVGKIEADLSSEVIDPPAPVAAADVGFAGFRFPVDVIVAAVRGYLRFDHSLWRRGGVAGRAWGEVDHVTLFRWVQQFRPLPADAARFVRHSPGDRWFVDETYVKVNGL